MTPDQRNQIASCKRRITSAREGGQSDTFIRAGLMSEGWPEEAITHAFIELGQQ